MNTEAPDVPSIGELVRQAETDYVSGTTHISKYVSFQMHDTLERIDAYINSKHTSGATDAQGRDKPFFNIVTAAINIWFRATDIDRSDIKVRATKSKDWIDSFLATVHLQDWMRRSRFGVFLNEWGRSLARYGSTVIKFVETGGELHISVIPWNTLIVDPVDFDANPKIEILELTEAQLRGRVNTHGYDKAQVDSLILAAKTARETLDKKRKDNKSGYYKLYEVHGKLPLSHLTLKAEDGDTYVQQMHVVSFVGTRKGRATDYQDFTLYAGREAHDPYMITHLIREDGRTLAIGAVEHLFDPQWMMNHSVKQIKDQLDLTSKLVFQTSDGKFVGRNVLTDIENGDIFVHALNQPLSQVNNTSHDITSSSNFAVMWKGLGNEINGISEAMLGETPKSGTAWRQTQAVLQESYSLFELMTENKGLAIDDMMRLFILPYIRKQLDNSKEVAAELGMQDIRRIDGAWIKAKVGERVNDRIKQQILQGEVPTQESQQAMTDEETKSLGDTLRSMGNKRFFKPSEISSRTWKTQFKDLEWELEIDVTGEAKNVQEALATLNTALQLVMTPGFAQNQQAQAIVGRILEMAGAMSPVEYNSLPQPEPIPVAPEQATGQAPPGPANVPLLANQPS